jgi:hypothetical protein
MNSLITTYNKVNKALNSAVNNAIPNVKNISNIATPITAPIAESMNAIPSNAASALVTLPIIFGLGFLIIAIILFTIFREQITVAIERMYQKGRELLGISKSSDTAPPIIPLEPVVSDSHTAIVDKIVPPRKEVFNIGKNVYTYNDAEPLCKALGAELATYDQVKDAWNRGADWCNYGWVKGQTAVYPTQKETWDKMQDSGTDDQRMACGNIGVNGGYFDNPDLRFGVNCYGVKPEESSTDEKYIQSGNEIPETAQQLAFDKKVLSYKADSKNIPILPFKPGMWSS